MRREDAGINSPVADGKRFNFNQGGEDGDQDANARAEFARMTTTHKVRRPPKEQGWCACFSMCFGSADDDETETEEPVSADQPPAHLMTQVERPDKKKQQTRNTQPDSRTDKGAAGASTTQERSGLQSPRKEDIGSVALTVEMTDNKRPKSSSGNTSAAGTPDRSEIERFAYKTGDDGANDPKGLLKPNKTRFKKTLVLDLDETLVHSSFRPVDNPTFIIPVHIDNHVYNVYVLKRPYTDIFLERAAKCYEIIIFTASLAKYADPLLDELDKKKVINGRLFRDSCVMSGKTYVKDLSVLGRELKNLIIVDNSPLSYQFQPTNAINCTSWFDDPEDTELLDMLPLLETTLMETDDVRKVLDAENITYPELTRMTKRDTNTGREPMWGYSDGTGS